jgi:hypothetical protein
MSEILEIAHDMAKSLFDIGAMDEITLREVEAFCLPKRRISNLMKSAAFANAIMSARELLPHCLESGKPLSSNRNRGGKSQAEQPTTCSM